MTLHAAPCSRTLPPWRVGVHQHVALGRFGELLQLRAAPIGDELAHRDELVAGVGLSVQPRRQPAEQVELPLPPSARLVERRSWVQSLHQQREAIVARAEQPWYRAGRLPECERVAFARELGVVAVAPRVELEHRAVGLADQGNAAAFERPRIAHLPVHDRRLEALGQVGRESARVGFGPELGPLGGQPLQRLYENGSGSTALGILISGGP
jgi:hypothetical protein